MRVGMGAGGVKDVLGVSVGAPRHRDEDGNAQVAGDVQDPQFPVARAVMVRRARQPRVVETVEIDLGQGDPVIPPAGEGVALDQFEKALEDRLLQRVAGRAAVRVRRAIDGFAVERRGVIQHRCRQPSAAPGRQGPHRRPVDLGVGVEALRDVVEPHPPGVDLVGAFVLPVAEILDGVGVDRLAVGKIREAGAAADLVAVEDSGIALDRLAQRARLGLFGRGALARTPGPQTVAQHMHAVALQGEIAARPPDMEPRVGLVADARQFGHDAAYGVDQMAEFAHRLRRPRRTQAAAVADGIRVRPEAQRRRRAVGTMEAFLPADGALRTPHRLVAGGVKAEGIERADVVAKHRRVAQDDPPGDLDGGEAEDGAGDRRRNGRGGDAGRLAERVAQEIVGLAIAAHPVFEAFPARRAGVARPEHRPHERPQARRPDERPRDSGLDVAAVGPGVAFRQVIVGHEDRERGGCAPLRRDDPCFAQRRGEAAASVAGDRDGGGGEALFGASGRDSVGAPERRHGAVHGELRRYDAPLRRQRDERRLHLDPRILSGEGGRDLAARPRAVQQRQDIDITPPAEQRAEAFRDQEGRRLADDAEFEVRREHRALHESAVGFRDIDRRPAFGERAGAAGRGLLVRSHRRTAHRGNRAQGGAGVRRSGGGARRLSTPTPLHGRSRNVKRGTKRSAVLVSTRGGFRKPVYVVSSGP